MTPAHYIIAILFCMASFVLGYYANKEESWGNGFIPIMAIFFWLIGTAFFSFNFAEIMKPYFK
jgi:lipopolysaccharide export LptBFGC system permease protein LptF